MIYIIETQQNRKVEEILYDQNSEEKKQVCLLKIRNSTKERSNLTYKRNEIERK